MRYFSLDYFKSKFGAEFEWKNAHQFSTNFSSEEAHFIASIQSETSLIFLDWIDRMTGLKQLLENGSATSPFKDDLKLLSHALSSEFKQFITPMLSKRLLAFSNLEEGKTSLTYIVLLENDTRGVVEDQLYKLIDVQFADVRALSQQKVDENTLIQATQKAVNDEVIQIINALSRQSYALKLKYVDAVLSIVNAQSCTLRFANWLLKQLEKLQLNEEHLYKINDLRADLKAGILQVKNTNTRKGTQIAFRTVLLYASIFIIGFAVFWIIAYKPFSEPDKPQLAKNSSYTKFTVDERKQIDSLLKVIQPSRQLAPESFDLGTYLGDELELVLRVPFKNEIAEKYYTDLNTYLQHYDALKPDSCIKQSAEDIKAMLPMGMSPISAKSTGKPAYFKNESEYDVQLIIFSNLLKSTVYYAYVGEGKTASIPLEVGDWFMVVPGSSLNKFAVPKGYNDDQPSSDFNISFCDIDINFLHGINSSYALNASNRVNYKFLLVGSSTEQFEVIDIHGVLSAQ